MRNILNKIYSKINSSKIISRYAVGVFWSLLSTIISRFFSLLTAIFIARLLGKEGYGIFGMVQSTLSVGLLIGFSMAGTLTKYISEYKYTDKNKVRNIYYITQKASYIISTLIMIVMIILARWLAVNVFKNSNLESYLYTGSVLMFITIINSIQVGAVAGFEDFKGIGKINCIQTVLNSILAVPLVLLYDIQGALVAIILSTFVSCIQFYTLINNKFKEYGINSVLYWRETYNDLDIIYRYTFPNYVSGIVVVLSVWISNTILITQGNGFLELGLFNAANQWRQLITFLPQLLVSVTIPILSQSYAKEDKKDFVQAFNVNMKLSWAIALPITTFVILFRGPLSEIFGKQYRGMEVIVLFLMVTSFLGIISNVIGTTLLSIGYIWTLAISNLTYSLLLIVLTIMLVPKYLGVGLAVAYLVATLLAFVVNVILIKRRIAFYNISEYFGYALITAFVLLSIMMIGMQPWYNILVINILLFLISCFPFLLSGYKYIYIK